jgi:hypothetical protein
MHLRISSLCSTVLCSTVLCSTMLLLGACGVSDEAGDPGDPGFVYKNQIFRNTQLVTAAKSGANATPAFSWQALGEKHVVLAIFSERIQVAQDHIANGDKVVWLWHTGLGSGREGNVLFAQGAKDEAGAPPPG